MKIAVVGCGAVGSYYGAKLARDGQEVHFLLRSDYDAVRRSGVFIKSPEGDFHVRPKCARHPEEIGPVELALIGLKTTANSEFEKLLMPLVAQGTALMTLQNGLGNEEALAEVFPADQILGGLCFVCLNRLEPGVIRHSDHGKIVMGEFQRWPEPRTHDIASMIRHAGVPCSVTDNLARTHWEKLVWNIPFNGMGVAAVAGLGAFDLKTPFAELQTIVRNTARSPKSTFPTSELLGDRDWAAIVRGLMLEVIAAGRTLGYDIPDSLADLQLELTRTMGAYKASTLIDFERRQPLELQSLFLEPYRQACKAGVSTPLLERLCCILDALDPGKLNEITAAKQS